MYRKILLSAAVLFIAVISFNVTSAQPVIKYLDGITEQPFLHTPRGAAAVILQHSQFRSYDGTNNNIGTGKAEWGATDVPLFRELPASYGSADLNNAVNGETRPSPRQISNVMVDEPETQFNNRDVSAMSYVWGQFLDHDIDLTPVGSTENLLISLPSDEVVFTEPIPFTRSEIHPGTGTTNQREQTNLITSWIDGSVVYGSDATTASWLRTHVNGKMKTSTGNYLPWNTTTGEFADPIDPTAPSMANDGNHTIKTFAAGDVRASENPGLLSLQTLFVREHNRICNQLIAQGYVDDELMYQTARKRVGALIQVITYQEFLPSLGIKLASYTSYNSTVRPDIMNTFATASFRIGHTMVADEEALRDNDCEEVEPGEIGLVEAFWTPQTLVDFGPEPFLKGFSGHLSYEIDNKINSVLRNFLFGSPNDPIRFGIDLASLNIQRGRDHGLPDYNTARQLYIGSRVTQFSQITADPVKQAQLQSLYGNVNNIDLWVGLLSEDHVSGKSVGKTMHAMLKSQFEKLRNGDYYFYSSDPFITSAIRNQLKHTTLSQVIMRNTTLTTLQSNVFFIDPCPGEDGTDRLAATIDAGAENAVFSVYPNPVKDVLNVRFSNPEGSSTLKIFNASGMLVKTITTTSEERVSINVNDFANGVYVMHMTSGNQTQSYRFVKLANN